jgi:hypothetical protein
MLPIRASVSVRAGAAPRRPGTSSTVGALLYRVVSSYGITPSPAGLAPAGRWGRRSGPELDNHALGLAKVIGGAGGQLGGGPGVPGLLGGPGLTDELVGRDTPGVLPAPKASGFMIVSHSVVKAKCEATQQDRRLVVMKEVAVNGHLSIKKMTQKAWWARLGSNQRPPLVSTALLVRARP